MEVGRGRALTSAEGFEWDTDNTDYTDEADFLTLRALSRKKSTPRRKGAKGAGKACNAEMQRRRDEKRRRRRMI